jgi:DNA-directed RNA polymerase sigma subunit (sigma70/sigma32)
MTIEQAKEKLTTYRKKQRELRKKIDVLRDFLRSSGTDPDVPVVDLTQRNRDMYNRYLDGLTWAEIASEYNLSKERIKQICNRIEVMDEKKARREQDGE